MEVTWWNELNDQQAEKACGGEGIGETVSDTIKAYRPLTPKEFSQGLQYESFGQAISNLLAKTVNGPQVP